MSAIAKILHEKHYIVGGSDIKESANTMRLKDLGVRVFIGHKGSQVRGADIVIVSSAIPKNNVEIIQAKALRIPVIPRAEALAWIMNNFNVRIGVAGTHGKTTTTSMISFLLDRCGSNPTFLIGGEANDVDGNAKLGNGEYVVAEADESDGSFLLLEPTVAVITNIEVDHLEHYGDIEKIIEAFMQFAEKVPKHGAVIVNIDHPNNKILFEKLQHKNCITYGFDEEAAISARNITFNKMGSEFEVFRDKRKIGKVNLAIPGKQNILNALASLATGIFLGQDFTNLNRALRYFVGVRRRFEILGTIGDIMVIDDYAHHPTEIKVTLEAVRLGWGRQKRIMCIFQPHRYTRTMYLNEEFKDAFEDAELVIITDVYSAGEDPIKGISGKLIADKLEKRKEREVRYIPKKEKIADFIMSEIKSNDVIVFAGAGDIHTVAKEVLARLKEGGKFPPKAPSA